MRVMMMIKGDREPGHLPSQELLIQMGKYNEELSKAGVLLDLSALHWSADGVRIAYSGGERTVTRGPFGAANEIVAGYWMLEVKSMDEAIDWAKRLPFEAGGEPEAVGEMEIRQVFEMDDFGESPAIERTHERDRESQVARGKVVPS
ncbi:MAG TPA: YciI family protein [Actinomycetota bacterium]